MSENIEKLIILNYNTGDIIICSNPPEDEDTETILKRLGLSINDCAIAYNTRAQVTEINYNNIK